MTRRVELLSWLVLGVCSSVLTIWVPALFPAFFVVYLLLTYRSRFRVALSLLCSLLITLAVVPIWALLWTDWEPAQLLKQIIPAYMQMNLFGLLLIGILGTYIGTVLDAINARPIESEPTHTVSLSEGNGLSGRCEMSDSIA